MLRLFQSYVAIGVFMLQVTSVLSGCCICLIHMLQVYVLNVSFASDIFHPSVSYCKCFVFQRYVHSHEGTTSPGLADGPCGAPRILRMGCAHPHPDSQVPPAQREKG
jgi:hypothetical protein